MFGLFYSPFFVPLEEKTDLQIISDDCSERLVIKVKDALSKGWNISGCAYFDGKCHYQPMTTLAPQRRPDKQKLGSDTSLVTLRRYCSPPTCAALNPVPGGNILWNMMIALGKTCATTCAGVQSASALAGGFWKNIVGLNNRKIGFWLSIFFILIPTFIRRKNFEVFRYYRFFTHSHGIQRMIFF